MSEQNTSTSAKRDVVVESYANFSSLAVLGGQHTVVIDEPAEFQGDGIGPQPFGLIIAALGGCMVGTLRGVARQHDFDYDKAIVNLSYRINLNTNGPLDPDERELRITRIIAKVTVHGDLTDEQKQLLTHGVETCPVGNTLRRGLNLVESVEFVA